MAFLANLKYPKKSRRKKVCLPERSLVLAEFVGIMMGDGGIGSQWQACITLNSQKDSVYIEYIDGLIQKLFTLVPKRFYYPHKNAIRLMLNSVEVVDFLVAQGLPRGDKLKNGLGIPDWIKANPYHKRMCVRGLVDTDGCMYVHVHKVGRKIYKNIGLSFFSKSPELIAQVAGVFEENGIMPHITSRGTDIYIYRSDSVAKYLEVFGTSNPRIGAVYEDWKRGRVVEGARLESV